MTDSIALRAGDKVRHRAHGWTGTVVSLVGQPLLRMLDRKVVVRIERPFRAVEEHHCWASDLERVDAAPVAAVLPMLPQGRAVRAGLVLIDGGRGR